MIFKNDLPKGQEKNGEEENVTQSQIEEPKKIERLQKNTKQDKKDKPKKMILKPAKEKNDKKTKQKKGKKDVPQKEDIEEIKMIDQQYQFSTDEVSSQSLMVSA